jgi:hypothetical protein
MIRLPDCSLEGCKGAGEWIPLVYLWQVGTESRSVENAAVLEFNELPHCEVCKARASVEALVPDWQKLDRAFKARGFGKPDRDSAVIGWKLVDLKGEIPV